MLWVHCLSANYRPNRVMILIFEVVWLLAAACWRRADTRTFPCLPGPPAATSARGTSSSVVRLDLAPKARGVLL